MGRTAQRLSAGRRNSPGPSPRAAVAGRSTAVVVTGLIVLADWLASQEHFLLQRLQDLPRSGAQADLAAYFARVRPVAEGLVADAGLEPLHVPAASFAESFPAISEPFGLQASVAEHLPELVHGPGLLIVTAPTGEGKTEVGKHAADLMGEAAGRTGRRTSCPPWPPPTACTPASVSTPSAAPPIPAR